MRMTWERKSPSIWCLVPTRARVHEWRAHRVQLHAISSPRLAFMKTAMSFQTMTFLGGCE